MFPSISSERVDPSRPPALVPQYPRVCMYFLLSYSHFLLDDMSHLLTLIATLPVVSGDSSIIPCEVLI